MPSSHVRAVITNSGQANAATGAEGRDRNWAMALAAARSVGCLPHQVLTASTGMIGIPLEIDKIAITEAERGLSIGSPSLAYKHSMLLAVGFKYRRLRSSIRTSDVPSS